MHYLAQMLSLHNLLRASAAGARRQIAKATGVSMQAKPAVILNAGSWAFEHLQPLPPNFQVSRLSYNATPQARHDSEHQTAAAATPQPLVL